ncbi:hypothetical protein F5B20DRAFT_165962 [Whalleya microplaca]|nr:hypothetical protein F5B20DRAFT_165962 [Whalleya microplaca]
MTTCELVISSITMFRPMVTFGRVRAWIFTSLLACCILFATLGSYKRQTPLPSIYDYTDGRTRGAWLNGTEDESQSEETDYLQYLVQQYGLTNEVPWFAQRVRPRFNSRTRKSMTQVSSKFLSRDFQRVHADDESLDLHAEKAVQVSVTKSNTPDQLDASSLLFGISTSYDRLRLTYSNTSLIHEWTRWLTDGQGHSNGASLVLTLHHATSSQVGYVSNKMREVGIDAVVLPAKDGRDITGRYLDLVGMLAYQKDELSKEGLEKNFLALVDDDIFFPSIGKLLSRLNKFDAKEKGYIGMPSERSDWVVEGNTTLTYGGGAVIFTPPMMENVTQLPCIGNPTQDPTKTAKRTAQWDETLFNCIAGHTDENLHILPSFYTPEDDLYGLRSGYEGGIQPLTLHHYKHRHRFEPDKGHLVTSLCGEDCFLQRFWFRDDWILVNGHTISQYDPESVDVLPLKKSSLLVSQHSQRNEHTTTKTAGRLVVDKIEGHEERKVVSWAGTKRTWRLLDARVGPGGEVWQAYVKRRGSAGTYGDEDDRLPEDTVHTQDGPSDVDSVIVLIWERW